MVEAERSLEERPISEAQISRLRLESFPNEALTVPKREQAHGSNKRHQNFTNKGNEQVGTAQALLQEPEEGATQIQHGLL